MNLTASVGIFDSGVGGLSVLREIRSAMPAESLLYVADSANAPWGDKPVEYVRRRGLEIANFLVGQGVKAIVIGSNTGTAGAADALRTKHAIPVVGMEPAIKPAAQLTRSGVVGAIVTATMGASDRMASLLDRFGRDVRVISVPAPGLVEHVEAADLDSSDLRRLVESYINPLLDAGAVDVLQADATRCAGFTGFLQAAKLCEARHVPLSSHCAPALHLHIGCAAAPMVHAEYFHDHARIEKIFFEGNVEPDNGALKPDLSRLGMGLELKRADVTKYCVA